MKKCFIWLLTVVLLLSYSALADDMHYVQPTHEDISLEEAIAIAQNALQKAYQFPESELTSARIIADFYVTDEHPEYKRWLITFEVFDESNPEYVDHWYEAIVDSHGNIIADPDNNAELPEARVASLETNDDFLVYPPILEKYKEFAEYEGSYLVREWPIETKAEYSSEVRVHVLSALENEDYASLTNPDARFPIPHQEIIMSSKFAYGLPTESDVQLDEARENAMICISASYGLPMDTIMALYICYEYYDITNAQSPVWKFIFVPESFEGMNVVPIYKVILDAVSGKEISLEEYEWKAIVNTSAFHSIWY